MAQQDIGDIDNVLYPEPDPYSNLVYLIDKDPEKIARQYHAIQAETQILSAYSINGRHCLVVHVKGKVKKIIKKIRRK